MKIAISGTHGFIGSHLKTHLENSGHWVYPLVRDSKQAEFGIHWNPLNADDMDIKRFTDIDAVIHLAGENVFGLWTKNKKEKIRGSRVLGTSVLCEALSRMEKPPETFLCASAIGFYGNRGEEELNEDSPPGKGFLADVCKDWEGATEDLSKRGVRVANTRFGIVLDKSGGALRKMLPAFRLGLAGRLGSGRQYFSWVTLTDLLNAISFIIERRDLKGPINVVSPNCVTNEEFTKTFGKVLGRSTRLSVSERMLRSLLPGMAEEMLLVSQRVWPRKLEAAGFKFTYPVLESALVHALGREYGVDEQREQYKKTG